MSYVYVNKFCREKLYFYEKTKGEIKGSHREFVKNFILLAVLYIGTDLLISFFSVKLDLSSGIELLMWF